MTGERRNGPRKSLSKHNHARAAKQQLLVSEDGIVEPVNVACYHSSLQFESVVLTPCRTDRLNLTILNEDNADRRMEVLTMGPNSRRDPTAEHNQ